ncbi:arsenite oxidase small subunit [Tistlia consotensis]|uniref:Arsenite oxidase small subunit n=1 Tax=Tistlia consotensis USBA 355 TaxID=560819 RepID=A0A1Y6CGS5_9PROT|nr:arsenate reductase (azurin) small subunit [Tistlia consotensis]SMF54270.1 arsenite oxidase small subunit [Tistlia consotensis USBA 355]SNR86777.1 arsenite oxidase small subunit [Tistlia consotensis]
MTRCSKLVDVGRRQFLRGGAIAAAGAAAAVAAPPPSRAAIPGARVDYPSTRLANLADLKPDDPLDVAYPDDQAPGVLLKLGRKVEGGVGPDGDIVGFTTTCPHKGFPLSYAAASRTFNCPGHYSVFDAEQGGQQVWGHATQNLPQYVLRVDAKGDIYAEGLDELLYGRLSNVL